MGFAFSYSGVQTLATLLLFIFFCLLSYYVKECFRAIAYLGFPVILFWISWQMSKLLKWCYDCTRGHVDPSRKAVFVTGCSSGLGFKAAVKLDSMGFTVFAGCRVTDDERANNLRAQCSDRLRVIKVDVSRDEEVDKAVVSVETQLDGRDLWAVVNNAGVAALHGVEWTDPGVRVYQRMLDVNTLGVVRVTRGFLPLLRRTSGSRIVIVTSIEDRLETLTQPSYSMSKFAARAFANCLRREMKDWGIYVSVVQPAFYGTEMTTESNLLDLLETSWYSTPAHIREAYGEKNYRTFQDVSKASFYCQHADCTPVVEAMTDAVSKTSEPRYFYRMGSGLESVLLWIIDILPEEIIDHLQESDRMILGFKMSRFLSPFTEWYKFPVNDREPRGAAESNKRSEVSNK